MDNLEAFVQVKIAAFAAKSNTRHEPICTVWQFFIKMGYKEGLPPEEFFMHAITGRDSLMDTALRTPKSGYLYRRLSSALQDIKICYDETVRDANENIVQFVYGEDGLDVSKTEGGKINVTRIVKEIVGEK